MADYIRNRDYEAVVRVSHAPVVPRYERIGRATVSTLRGMAWAGAVFVMVWIGGQILAHSAEAQTQEPGPVCYGEYPVVSCEVEL